MVNRLTAAMDAGKIYLKENRPKAAFVAGFVLGAALGYDQGYQALKRKIIRWQSEVNRPS